MLPLVTVGREQLGAARILGNLPALQIPVLSGASAGQSRQRLFWNSTCAD